MQATKQGKAIKQSKVVDVNRGLLLVRYASAESEMRPPKVKITVNPKDTQYIDLVLNPDQNEALLWQPGSCLVARATRRGKLLVDVIPIDEHGSTAATVTLEPLSQGESRSDLRHSPDREQKSSSDDKLSLCCHVAGIGDVYAGPAEWIAGPSAPTRIEGLQINWPGKPVGLDVRYSVKLARPDPVSLRTIELGGYAGTRGKAIPIVGVALELSGPMASHFQIAAEATFLGSTVKRAIGREVKLTGVTGGEPLVGLRLRIDEVDTEIDAAPSDDAKASRKIRVFRSRTNQDEFGLSKLAVHQRPSEPHSDLPNRQFS